MSVLAEQGIWGRSASLKMFKSSQYRSVPRSMPRAMARDPGMKSLGQSSGQQVAGFNDQLAASSSQPSILPPSTIIQPVVPRSYNVSLFGGNLSTALVR